MKLIKILKEFVESKVKIGDIWSINNGKRTAEFKIVEIKDYFYVISFLKGIVDTTFNYPKELFEKKVQEGSIKKVSKLSEIKIKPKSKAQTFFDRNIKIIDIAIKDYKDNDDGNPYGNSIGHYIQKHGINNLILPKNWQSEDTKELSHLINDRCK